MKRFLLCLVCQFLCLVVFAQLNGDGYYRIRNLGSQRYIIVTDNKGSINVSSTSADLGAVKMYRGFENVVSDPGSILYVNEVAGLYRFNSQGTDTHEIIGYDLKLKKQTDGSYLAYQEESFVRLYLCDARKENTEDGVLSTKSDATTHRNWQFLPVSAAGNEYFGVTSELSYEGSYYSTLYASFPFTFASSGMTAYYVSAVENGVAVMDELPNGAVPASVPVIIRASSSAPTDNRLHIGANSATKPGDNKLGGVYFHNTSKTHNNLTPYNPETMRVLGLTSTGKLGFVKADMDYLPANKAYLNVPAATPDEVLLMTRPEYDVYMNQTFEVKVSAQAGGKVAGAGTFRRFAQATLTATPDTGHSFSMWSDGTTANPYTFKVTADVAVTAHFTPNTYRLTYMLDGVEYLSRQCTYGEPVEVAASPQKAGYTFSGWSEVPATMPAGDVTVKGSLIPNVYQVTYMVDGQVYKIDSLACDQPFKVEPILTREGYNFDGWKDVPATMPAGDIVLSGTFVVNRDNKFNLIYMVDGQEYKRLSVSFGDAIELLPNPVKEGYTFTGWSEAPATMPLKDIVVAGRFVVNSYTLICMVDGQVYATETLTYGSPIVLPDAPVREGFIFGGWGDVPLTMPACDVTVYAQYVDGIGDVVVTDRRVDVYTLQGVRVKSQVLFDELHHELPAGIYIVNGRKLLVK